MSSESTFIGFIRKTKLFCLISVGYYSELHVAIICYQLSYINVWTFIPTQVEFVIGTL